MDFDILASNCEDWDALCKCLVHMDFLNYVSSFKLNKKLEKISLTAIRNVFIRLAS